MNILCSICARGGSKGLPMKNIKTLKGKPLIAWSIEQALRIQGITDVIVSTDSKEIVKVAKEYGAKIPFLRPAVLAEDGSGKWDVWQHALKTCEEIYKKNYDLYIDLDCTSPLRDDEDIYMAINKLINSKADCIFSICESRKNPYFNMVEYENNYLKMSKPTNPTILCRQNAPKVYDHVASIYVLKTDFLRKNTGLLTGKAIGYELSSDKGIDIDTDIDFKIVETLFAYKYGKEV